MKTLRVGIITVVLLLFFAGGIGWYTYRNIQQTKENYAQSVQLLENEEYNEALALLEKLPSGDQDKEVLVKYGSARQQGDLTDQYRQIHNVPTDYAGVMSETILAYRTSVESEYQNYQDEQARLAEERRKQQAEEEKERNSKIYPSYGTRESVLKYCALGTPTVEKCRDFDHLVARAQYKTYTYGTTGKPNSGKITVRYRVHHSNRYDDYTDYPSTNGYASSGYYFDADGVRYDFDFEGTKRNTQVSPVKKHTNSTSSSSASSSAATEKGASRSDPYDVYEYDDPEDFYYDWMDDFDGYEDAEDYWEEAQDYE